MSHSFLFTRMAFYVCLFTFLILRRGVSNEPPPFLISIRSDKIVGVALNAMANEMAIANASLKLIDPQPIDVNRFR